MTGHVYIHPGLTEDDLRDLLKNLDGLDYAIQETEVRIRFIHFVEMNTLWDEGRAFGEGCEVRWQLCQTSEVGYQSLETSEVSSQQCYRVQVLNESESPPASITDWPEKQMDIGDEQKLYLWGRHWHELEGVKDKKALPNAWTEALIPGLETLKYPLEPVEFAYITTVDYQQNGITLLTRFKGLEGETQEQRKVKNE